ncbi:FAD/NAD(P)-binding protein [Polaromonas hydrogenivorans]
MEHTVLSDKPSHIAIVGGGFSGVCAAVQLVRSSPAPLHITLIEPRDRVGLGLAYSSTDPDHRLNGPTWVHSIDPEDSGHFTRWCEKQDLFSADPQALLPDGSAFVRRADFGRYMEAAFREHAQWPATQSTITHLRARAVDALEKGDSIELVTDAGHALVCDLLIIATGNPQPRLQAPLDASLAAHPGVIENPLDTQRLLEIPAQADVLIIGSSLTALDVLATLLRQGHTGRVVSISRRGLQPRPQAPSAGPLSPPPTVPVAPATATGRQMLDRILGPAPDFLTQPGVEPTLRAWIRALRQRIGEVQAQGASWHLAFDELRDVVWRTWPLLPTAEKRRFLKKARTWYDVHRFRSPPQTQSLVRAAQAQGRVVFRADRIQSVAALEASGSLQVCFAPRQGNARRCEAFEVIINCTGLDVLARVSSNPFLSALMDKGWLTPDACGIGFAVDEHCRALTAKGTKQRAVRVIGPPTAGTFGDPLGAMFIAAQIYRIVPDILSSLGASRIR